MRRKAPLAVSPPKRRPPWPVPGWSRKRNKFHVAPKEERTWNGKLYASKGEMQRHKELLLYQQCGKISNLESQIPLVLSVDPTGKALLKWVADWRYIEDGLVVVEDFTGVMTPLKRTKIRMCAAVYPDLIIRISRVVGAGKHKHTESFDCVKGRVPQTKRKRVLKIDE